MTCVVYLFSTYNIHTSSKRHKNKQVGCWKDSLPVSVDVYAVPENNMP